MVLKNIDHPRCEAYFATFALANGVSIESVAKMLGHTNVQMTRHYARVLDRTVIREMSQIKMDFHFSVQK